MERRNIVFILGAGCSKEDGVPLVNEFFDMAEKVNVKSGNDESNGDLEVVLGFRTEYLPGSNIEELFSFIDLQTKLRTINFEQESLEDIKKALIRLIKFTIKESVKDDKVTYAKMFFNGLSPTLGMSNVHMVTLNWDLLLDNALMQPSSGGCRIEYGTRFKVLNKGHEEIVHSTSQNPTLYKLHGSLSWSVCSSCGEIYFNYQANPPKINYFENSKDKLKCQKCKMVLIPLMLPPTFSKFDEEHLSKHLREIWYLARHILINADRVIMVGYSLPENDLHFKLFFRNVLRENLNKNEGKGDLRIEIINFIPYSKNREIFEERHKEIFDSVNNSYDRSRKIVPTFIYQKFSDYIIEGLSRLSQSESRAINP